MLTIFQSAAVAVVALPMGAAAQHSTSNTAGQVTGATVKAAMMLGQGNAQFGLAGVPSQLTIAGKGTCDMTVRMNDTTAAYARQSLPATIETVRLQPGLNAFTVTTDGQHCTGVATATLLAGGNVTSAESVKSDVVAGKEFAILVRGRGWCGDFALFDALTRKTTAVHIDAALAVNRDRQTKASAPPHHLDPYVDTLKETVFGAGNDTLVITPGELCAGEAQRLVLRSEADKGTPVTVTGIRLAQTNVLPNVAVAITIAGTAGTCDSASINFGDGSSIMQETASFPLTMFHRYGAPGSYSIAVSSLPAGAHGKSNPCRGGATAAITVSMPTVQAVTATRAPLPKAPTKITVAGEGGPCKGARVDYGDGTQGTVALGFPAQLSHTYAKGGHYTVTVTGVTECAGRATTAVDVMDETDTRSPKKPLTPKP